MLQRCIKKLGKQINSLDRSDLEEAYAVHIGKGLSEYDASVEAIADFHKIVFDEMKELRGLAAIKPLEYKRYERPQPPVAKTEPIAETKTRIEPQEATDDGNVVLRSVPDSVDAGFRKWRRTNITYRGVAEEAATENGRGAMLGRGLYTAPSSNRSMTR